MLHRRPTSKPVGNAAAAVRSAQAMPEGAAVEADQVALNAQPANESVFNDWYKEKHEFVSIYNSNALLDHVGKQRDRLVPDQLNN